MGWFPAKTVFKIDESCNDLLKSLLIDNYEDWSWWYTWDPVRVKDEPGKVEISLEGVWYSEKYDLLSMLANYPSIVLVLAFELIRKCPGHSFRLYGSQDSSSDGSVTESMVSFDGVELKFRISQSNGSILYGISCECNDYEYTEEIPYDFLEIDDRPGGGYIAEANCPNCGRTHTMADIYTDEGLIKVDENGKFKYERSTGTWMDETIRELIAEANGED